jgi:hypothetical protein
MRQINGG